VIGTHHLTANTGTWIRVLKFLLKYGADLYGHGAEVKRLIQEDPALISPHRSKVYLETSNGMME